MYSSKIIARNLQRYEKHHIGPARLKRYSVRAARKNVELLDSLLDEHGQLDARKRPHGLLASEKAYIRNEIALSRIDFVYWLQRYAHVSHKETGQLVLFTPNTAQKIVLSLWADMEERGLAIAFLSIKARQLGISSLSEMTVAHRVQFQPNINAIIGSSDPEKSKLMSHMMEVCWDNQPWWMVPEMTARRAGILFEFGKQNSAVSIQHGTQFSGIARGTTTNCVHLCVNQDEFILLQDGSLKTMKEVVPGDVVLSSDGNLNRVKAAWQSPRTGKGTAINLWTLPGKLVCTDDHKVLTDLGYVEASQLKKGDFVVYPVRSITHEIESMEMRLPHPHQYRVQRNASIHSTKVVFNRELGRACGLYLAEGTINRTGRGDKTWTSGITISMHRKEEEVFAHILAEGLPLKSREYVRFTQSKDSQTASLNVYSAHIGEFFERVFGCTTEKRIPDWIWTTGTGFCKGLIEGYLLGDGHIPDHAMEMPATSICASITYQLQRLIASCGFGWSSVYARDSGVNYGRNCRKSYTLNIAGETAYRIRQEFGWKLPREMNRRSWRRAHWMWIAGGHVGVQVRKVEEGHADAYWDLEVDAPVHNFTTMHGCLSNSELADFDNPTELIDASLMGAAHESPSLFLALESTAKGRDNWVHDNWRNSKENWPRTLLRPVFLPWYVADDMYPPQTFLRRNPIPADWTPKVTTQKTASKAALYVRNYAPVRQHLGNHWQMRREQQWWWECKREEAVKKRQLGAFLSETPGSDIEAFQSTNASAFDSELVAEIRDNALSQEPHVFAFTGEAISGRLYPDARDIQNLPHIPVSCRWRSDLPAINFELVPLKFESYQEDPTGRLYIWKFPEENQRYVIGTDTSDGIGQDRTVLQVIRLRDPYDASDLDEQVAEYASAYVNARDLWPLSLCLGTYYTTPTSTGKIDQIRQVIECNGNGESVQFELQKLGWWNFHPWMHYDNKKPTRHNKIGWFTNVRTRSMAVDTIVSAIRDEWLTIRSPWFVDEMASFERDEYRQSLRAGYGAHDDRIMSMAFALFSSYVLEITTDGRSFFTNRKRMPGTEPAVSGLRPEQLTQELLKELNRQRDPYARSGHYNPY
jgi:hypothetical protein